MDERQTKEKALYFIELDGQSRRVFQDMSAIYRAWREAREAVARHAGGMHWKRSGGREYLFRTRGGRGYGRSLGVRSPETEAIYRNFSKGKKEAIARLDDLREAMNRQAKFCVAAGINRVPKVSANVIRILEHSGLLDRKLMVLGTHALYAYEAAAGVQFDSGTLSTMDIDILFDAKAKLRLATSSLAHEIESEGLIGLIKKADPTFRVEQKGHFRATNSRGFMVELVKALPNPPQKVEENTLSEVDSDLVAAEMKGFSWLSSAPRFRQIVIAEDGFPLEMVVPDPRFFALNKRWVSTLPDRNPVKKPRDRTQADLVAQIAVDYLGLAFEDPALQVFPEEIRKAYSDPHALNEEDTPPRVLPPGFDF